MKWSEVRNFLAVGILCMPITVLFLKWPKEMALVAGMAAFGLLFLWAMSVLGEWGEK